MAIAIYSDTLDSEIPRLVANVLRSDGDALEYFNGLADHDFEELRHWAPKPPYLAVVPGQLDETQVGLSDRVDATYRINVVAYLPLLSPSVDPGLSFSQVPAAAASGAGVLTGAYRWALTGYTDAAESFVPEASNEPLVTSALTLSSQKATLTLPALPDGFVGRCLWRTRAGGSRFRLEAVLGDATTYEAVAPDSDLLDVSAPIRHESRRLRSWIKRTLVLDADLRVAGRGRARKLMIFADRDDAIRLDRAVRVVVVSASYSLTFDATERTS